MAAGTVLSSNASTHSRALQRSARLPGCDPRRFHTLLKGRSLMTGPQWGQGETRTSEGRLPRARSLGRVTFPRWNPFGCGGPFSPISDLSEGGSVDLDD